ncbi:MAG: asparaginase [Bacillota bacterium]
MKTILLIGTGGTIASTKGKNGIAPEYDTNKLLELVPEVLETYKIHSIQISNIDSTNIQSEHWLRIADTIQKNYEDYDGFVITHGTDTMAYTAAAISYLIQNSRKPIVITGSQKTMMEVNTDAARNLRDSLRFASGDIGGVFVVFGGKVINGCRAVKVRTKSINAYESVNLPAVAVVNEEGIKPDPQYLVPHDTEGLKYYSSLCNDVFLLKLTPGISPDIFDFIKQKYKGVVIESFGSGGIPFMGKANILDKIEDLVCSGVIVVITTQCLFEGGNLNLYEVGRKVMETKIIPAYDMTTEAAVIKLMWVLSRKAEFNEIKDLFLTPIGNDLVCNDKTQ